MSAAPRSERSQRVSRNLDELHGEASLGDARDLQHIWRLVEFVRPYQRWLWIAVAAILLTALVGLGRPLVMRWIVDAGALAHNPSRLLQGGLALFALILVEQVLSFVQVYLTQLVGARALSDLRQRLFEFLHGLRLGFFDHQPVGRLVTRLTGDVDAVQELFAAGALAALGDLVRLVGIVAMMLALDPKLTLVALAAVPVVAGLVQVMRRRLRDAYREVRGKTARLNAELAEQINGLAVIQAYGREAAAAREFDRTNLAYCQATIRAIRYDSIQDAALESAAAICLAALVIAAGYAPTSFGTLVAFSAYLVQFFEPISTLSQRYTLLQSALAGLERVFGLLDTPGEDDARPVAGAPRSVVSDAAFELRQVDFSYRPGVPVLVGVSFAVPRGQTTALVGLTGSGKSTIGALLERLYEPQGGSILVDGRDVRGWDRESLRRRFAVVPQDPTLFPGTVAANVAAGEEPDPERVREVLRQVGLWDLVEGRPGGIGSTVEEQGNNFSLGERQLMACARALYRGGDILILDEATASVDSDTEARLARALAVLLQGRTALVIAHRASTVRRADRILVLHHGRIVQHGTHEALSQSPGLYRQLYELQLAQHDGGA
jgi:ATP-binding cassette, subfamily B, multidrug efflux pump